MMKLGFALACMLAAASAKPTASVGDSEWEDYKRSYGKHYGDSNSELDNLRRTLYANSKELVQAHNELYEKGLKSYTMAINQFSDLHPKEFAQRFLGFQAQQQSNAELHVPQNVSLPETVDWRSRNAVTGVKNQGGCGSCWAFSATGALEGQWALKKGQLVSVSEQQLVDCTYESERHSGCEGGVMSAGFDYIRDNGGIDSEDSYPYTAQYGSCKFNRGNVVATLNGYRVIQGGSESALQDAVANVGPISVGIVAAFDFQSYSSGVYDEPRCNTEGMNHGVLVVGYGNENGKDYWLVKNSWGSGWGDSGYIKMRRNSGDQCRIADQATYPVVE